MLNEKREALLEYCYYHQNCPGCKVDRRKRECTNPPWLPFFFIWMVTLAAALPISSIYPFLYNMVSDFDIAQKEEDVSFYGGFEGSAFMIGRTLTAIMWGVVADRYGRKPVMILGLLAIVIFNTLFGLSSTYWMAIATRFLLGAFCGILGPIRAYATEISRKEHQSLGVSMISSSWGIGLVIGPAIGGYLAQPAVKFPNVFSQDSIFGRFPYFLASLVISIFAFGVLILSFWFPESLHTHNVGEGIQDQPHQVKDLAISDLDDEEKMQITEARSSTSSLHLLRNWPFVSVILLFCVFQLHDVSYLEVFSLWGVSPKAYGGLNLSTEDLGQALAVSGASLLFCQVFLYPILEKELGAITVSRAGAICTIMLLSSYPVMSKFSDWKLKVLLDVASALKNVLSVSITTGLLILQNRAVSQQHRGAANGISLCAMSLVKGIGPAAAGIILSWAETRPDARFLPGSHMIFFILNVIEFVGFVMTFDGFLGKPNQELS